MNKAQGKLNEFEREALLAGFTNFRREGGRYCHADLETFYNGWVKGRAALSQQPECGKAQLQVSGLVPEGWKLVPVEPTLEMIGACLREAGVTSGYQAMLAAAPVHPQSPDAGALVDALTDAARDVLAERNRQITAEGWTPEHDDGHDAGELAAAAAAYSLHAAGRLNPLSQGDGGDDAPNCWPWHDAIAVWGAGPEKTEPVWWKPGAPRRNLIKAGALILAEIERIDRAQGKGAEG